MNNKKKLIIILCCIFLLVLSIIYILDKTVIFQISFDSDDSSLYMSEILPTLYQGAIDNPKNSMFCYVFRSEDTLTVIDCNPFKRRNETWDYLFNPSVYIDGIPIECRLDFKCLVEKKIVRFWNTHVLILFSYDSKGNLCSEVQCDNYSDVELDGYEQCFTCTIIQ